MGACMSSNQDRAGTKAAALQDDTPVATTRGPSVEADVHTLLVLGAGESGKSTLLKQMKALFGTGFPLETRKEFLDTVCENTIQAAVGLLRGCQKLGIVTPTTAEFRQAADLIEQHAEDSELSEELASAIELIWRDEGVREAYERRAEFQLPDSAAYFLDKVREVVQGGYVPSEQDVLRTRVRTTGIVSTQFDIDGVKFSMRDVGGQRSERKKWLRVFEELATGQKPDEKVTGIIYVVAISEYDQVMFEDANTNRLNESLALFDEVVNSRWFLKTPVILFLNKRDLFEEKIKKKPLTTCFPNYTGPQSFEACVRYIRDQFAARNRSNRRLYPHVTCATDTSNIAHVFNSLREIIIIPDDDDDFM
ncbi:MAG: hypothetical protein MHM6MM_001062 [Cercozoa sp. M6MM]